MRRGRIMVGTLTTVDVCNDSGMEHRQLIANAWRCSGVAIHGQNLWNNAPPANPLRRFDGNRFVHLLGGEDEREGGALLYFNLNERLPMPGATRYFPSSLVYAQEARKRVNAESAEVQVAAELLRKSSNPKSLFVQSEAYNAQHPTVAEKKAGSSDER